MYLFLSICISVFSLSVVQATETDKTCSASAKADDFYRCVLKFHPDEKVARLTADLASAQRSWIRRLPNPEVSYKSMTSDEGNGQVKESEIEVSVELTEMLLKTTSMAKVGRADKQLLGIQAEEEIFQARSRVIKDLFRYRQLNDELELAVEALQTFSKIAGQYRARKARGPDQDITLSLVELAQGDYQLKKNHLVVEKGELEARYKSIFGSSFSFKPEWLPAMKKDWPHIGDNEVSKNTLELRRAQAELLKAEAEHEVANREAWPKIAAGPIFEEKREGGKTYDSTGFSVSMTLPIFSQNNGARDFTEKKEVQAKYTYEYAAKKADLEKQLLLQKYRSSVESLKASAGTSNLASRHQKIDGLFRQGLTSGPTVIEAHRQIFEFTESQHEHEMTALTSLLYIKFLAGKEISEVLK